MNIKLINPNILKKTLDWISGFLKKRPSLVLATALLAVILASGAIFYFHVLQAPTSNVEQPIIKINKALYQEVIHRLDSRETNIQRGIGQNYRDVFR